LIRVVIKQVQLKKAVS